MRLPQTEQSQRGHCRNEKQEEIKAGRMGKVENTQGILALPVHKTIDPLRSIHHRAHLCCLIHAAAQQFATGLLTKGLGIGHAREVRP